MKIKSVICSSIFLLFLLSIPQAYALVLTDLNVKPEIWLNENSILNVSFSCNSSTANVSAEIHDSSDELFVSIFANDFIENNMIFSTSKSLNSLVAGEEYLLTAYCQENNETTNENATFFVHKLEMSIASLSYDTALEKYPGDTFTLEMSLLKDNVPVQSLTNDDFEVYLDNISLAETATALFQSDLWYITLKLPSDYLLYQYHNLKVEVNHENHIISATCTNCIKILPIVRIDILEPSLINIYSISESENLQLRAKIYCKSNLLPKEDLTDVKAILDGGEVTVNTTYTDGGDWKFFVRIPRLVPSDELYELKLRVTCKNLFDGESRPLKIQSKLLFKGSIIDAKGTPVRDVKISVVDDLIEEKTTTDNNGRYSLAVIPRTYDIYLSFPQMDVKLYAVPFEYNENVYDGIILNAIQYDYSADNKVEEFDSVKLVVLQFALPFNKAQFTVPYQDVNILDENKLSVYKCTSWNFGKRNCIGNWEKLSSSINAITNIATFDVSNVSAFIIAQSKSISLEASFEKDKYQAEEVAVINGKVVDKDNNAIANAIVSYDSPSLQIYGTTTTDSTGSFKITYTTPSKEGKFDIKLKAEKSSLTPITKTLVQEIYKKKEIGITLPLSLDMQLDESKVVEITIKNAGQIALKNITLSVDGILESGYKLEKQKIDLLNANEEVKINMNVTFTKNECGIGECLAQYKIRARANAEDISSDAYMDLNIIKEPKTEITGGILSSLSFHISKVYWIILILSVLFFATLITFRLYLNKTSSHKQSLVEELFNIKDETLKEEAPQEMNINNQNSQDFQKKKTKIKKTNHFDVERIIKNPFE